MAFSGRFEAQFIESDHETIGSLRCVDLVLAVLRGQKNFRVIWALEFAADKVVVDSSTHVCVARNGSVGICRSRRKKLQKALFRLRYKSLTAAVGVWF